MMRILSERCIQHDQDLYICFLDYEKAFDRVNRLMEVLSVIISELSILGTRRRLLRVTSYLSPAHS